MRQVPTYLLYEKNEMSMFAKNVKCFLYDDFLYLLFFLIQKSVWTLSERR